MTRKVLFAPALVMMSLLQTVHIANSAPKADSLADLFARTAPISIDRVSYSKTGSSQITSRFFSGRSMERIDLRFVSQVYLGVKCSHQAELFLPDRGRKNGVAALILGALQPSKNENFEWVEHVVLQMGIPCFVIQSGLNPKEFGVRTSGDVMSKGDQTFFKTGDPSDEGYIALAKIFSAAATVAEDLPELRASRFIATGSSKGGMAALIACAGDPRIAGSYPTAWNAGNALEFTRLKGERWGWDIKPKETGPAGQTARESMAMLKSPNGQLYQQLVDPYQWGDLLAGKVFLPAVGTNDPLFHLLTDGGYLDTLNCRKGLLRVPNYKHGKSTPLHTLGWRFAVAATLLGHPVPSVKLVASTESPATHLSAILSGLEFPARLELWKTTDETGDYRDAKWAMEKAVQVEPKQQTAEMGEALKPSSGTAAYFLLLLGEETPAGAVVSSNVLEFGQPLLHEFAPGK